MVQENALCWFVIMLCFFVDIVTCSQKWISRSIRRETFYWDERRWPIYAVVPLHQIKFQLFSIKYLLYLLL